jgi:hypothetical protein
VTLVGFENATSTEIIVDGPDADKIVWIGRTFRSALDAQLAVDALSKRLTRVQ